MPTKRTVSGLPTQWCIPRAITSESSCASRSFKRVSKPLGDPSSWQRFLGKEAQCHRSVDYYTELPDVYRRSDINFNITSCLPVNQRLFDVSLVDSFLPISAMELFDVPKLEEAKEDSFLPISGEHLVAHRVKTMLQSANPKPTALFRDQGMRIRRSQLSSPLNRLLVVVADHRLETWRIGQGTSGSILFQSQTPFSKLSRRENARCLADQRAPLAMTILSESTLPEWPRRGGRTPWHGGSPDWHTAVNDCWGPPPS